MKAKQTGQIIDPNNAIASLSQMTSKASNYEVRSGGAESHFSAVG